MELIGPLMESKSAGSDNKLKQESRETVKSEDDRKLVNRESRKTIGEIKVDNPRMTCRNVDVYYGDNHAIKNVSLDIGRHEVLAMIGPSGCGKSTFIRCLNRFFHKFFD